MGGCRTAAGEVHASTKDISVISTDDNMALGQEAAVVVSECVDVDVLREVNTENCTYDANELREDQPSKSKASLMDVDKLDKESTGEGAHETFAESAEEEGTGDERSRNSAEANLDNTSVASESTTNVESQLHNSVSVYTVGAVQSSSIESHDPCPVPQRSEESIQSFVPSDDAAGREDFYAADSGDDLDGYEGAREGPTPIISVAGEMSQSASTEKLLLSDDVDSLSVQEVQSVIEVAPIGQSVDL